MPRLMKWTTILKSTRYYFNLFPLWDQEEKDDFLNALSRATRETRQAVCITALCRVYDRLKVVRVKIYDLLG